MVTVLHYGKGDENSPLMAEALKNGELPNWQEICRQAIAARLKPENAQKLGWNDTGEEE